MFPANIATFIVVRSGNVLSNVLKTGPVTESEKLPGHGSLVGPVVEPWLNQRRNKYII